MAVWDVLGKRTEADGFVVVGAVKAPDAELALLLARETHFRHKEGVAYAVRARGSDRVEVGAYPAAELGGVTDRAYRRQEAYAGVGASAGLAYPRGVKFGPDGLMYVTSGDNDRILRFTASRFRDGYAETAAQRYVAGVGRGTFLPEMWYDIFEFIAYDPTVSGEELFQCSARLRCWRISAWMALS